MIKRIKRTSVNPHDNTLKLWWGLKKIKFGLLGGSNIRIIPTGVFANSHNIYIGNNVFIGHKAYMDAISFITIADGVMIGPHCTMIAGNHNYRSKDLRAVPYDNRIIDTPIVIERNVWIGADVTICPGTHIGEGAVIGAGCCVHGIIPKFAIVVPSNYRIVGYRDKEQYEMLVNKNQIYNCVYAGKGLDIVDKDKI